MTENQINKSWTNCVQTLVESTRVWEMMDLDKTPEYFRAEEILDSLQKLERTMNINKKIFGVLGWYIERKIQKIEEEIKYLLRHGVGPEETYQ